MTERYLVALTPAQRGALLYALDCTYLQSGGEQEPGSRNAGRAQDALLSAPTVSSIDAAQLMEALRYLADDTYSNGERPSWRTDYLRRLHNKIAGLFRLTEASGREWW